MRVLIVDDDMVTVDVIKNTVHWEELGITNVYTAYHMEAAERILLDSGADIVISDIEMPKGSGIDLLGWIREQEMDIEIILLTCHENFGYASDALKLHAAEYLLKPFDTEAMEQTLRKTICQIREKRALVEESMYGKWVKRNQRQLRADFLNLLLDGSLPGDAGQLGEEIQSRHLDIDPEGEYTLVLSKITDFEQEKERMGQNLWAFILSNLHAEILCGDPEDMFLTGYDWKDYYILVTACAQTDRGKLIELCQELLAAHKELFASTLTCCISNSCRMDEFYGTYQKTKDILVRNVVDYGGCFFADQIQEVEAEGASVLDVFALEDFLGRKKKMDFLKYLKQRLDDMAIANRLNGQTLQRAKQDVLQAIYLYLAKRGIRADGLFADEIGGSLTQKASQSVIDMVRWTSYAVTHTFEYEEEEKKTLSIVEKIHLYIMDHYGEEDLGRNGIAAEFCLAPEYLSKMYKKQTGRSLKDSIIECRMERAKILLETSGMPVSDVAEAVGIGNFAYFSTLFKKYTGMSPNQYRKREVPV